MLTLGHPILQSGCLCALAVVTKCKVSQGTTQFKNTPAVPQGNTPRTFRDQKMRKCAHRVRTVGSGNACWICSPMMHARATGTQCLICSDNLCHPKFLACIAVCTSMTSTSFIRLAYCLHTMIVDRATAHVFRERTPSVPESPHHAPCPIRKEQNHQ